MTDILGKIEDEKGNTIHVDMAEVDADLPKYSTGHRCPVHSSLIPETGYGMVGGGMGVYTYCSECNRMLSKSPDSDYEEGQFK